LSDKARQILKQLVDKHGPDLVNQPGRVKGLLLDLCAGQLREARLLAAVAENGMAGDLLRDGGRNLSILIPRMVDRLHEDEGFEQDLAKWAVETWADVLGVAKGKSTEPESSDVHDSKMFWVFVVLAVLGIVAGGVVWMGKDKDQGRFAHQPRQSTAGSQAGLEEFVNDYIAAANQGNISRILQLYAENVDYHGQGRVTKAFIRQDKQKYYRRWPSVANALDGKIDVQQTSRDNTTVLSFTVQFRARSPERRATSTGKARNTLVVANMNGQWRIVKEQQDILSRTIYND
jgi:ketosteroid isomerase-like protein